MDPAPHDAHVLLRPGEDGERLVMIEERLTIGRAPSNALLIDDPNASRHHAEIRRIRPGRYRIADVGSANGTWVNGRRLTVPQVLEDGDEIKIGGTALRFTAGRAEPPLDASQRSPSTTLSMRTAVVVVLASDVRGYTRMSEVLPSLEFSTLMSQWFREVTGLVERHGGTVDKFIGDAVLAYWEVDDPHRPADRVHGALSTARAMIERAAAFSERLAAQFTGHQFRIGIGISLGEVVMGNVGTREVQSFTIVGDPVNVAFRIESLTKEKGIPVLVTGAVAEWAAEAFPLYDLGPAGIAGRQEPVPVWGMS